MANELSDESLRDLSKKTEAALHQHTELVRELGERLLNLAAKSWAEGEIELDTSDTKAAYDTAINDVGTAWYNQLKNNGRELSYDQVWHMTLGIEIGLALGHTVASLTTELPEQG